MNDEKILEKAIQIAIRNGWCDHMASTFKYKKGDYSAWDTFDEDGWFRRGHYDEEDRSLSIADVIFNHDFAKALWGTGRPTNGQVWLENLWATGDNCDLQFDGELWQYHLQQMVIADDPIKYLGEHLDEHR